VPAAVPRSAVLVVVLSVLVAAGALAGAAAIRLRVAGPAGTSPTGNPPASSLLGSSGCLHEPCKVFEAAIGGTSVDLVADAGGTSGRMRVGGPGSGQVIEVTITDIGASLTEDPLQCVPGAPMACLIRGRHGAGVAGQVVVGRSGNWSSLEKPFISGAGYLALANVDADVEPEILAAQHDCRQVANCAGRPVFVQVFALDGLVVGCTKSYPKLDRLPDYPEVRVTAAQLTACR
jgi:hypothetical protein